MPDEDDLPDHDLESIYGLEALHARHLARHAERMARLHAQLAEHADRMAEIQQTHDAINAMLNRPHGR